MNDVVGHLGLQPVILAGVAVAAIHHQTGQQARLLQRLFRERHIDRVVVRVLAAAQDHVTIRVALGLQQRDLALLVDPHEGVGAGSCLQRIDGGAEVAVGAVLEANRHGEAGGHLPVGLGFGGAGTDGRPGEELRQVLRADGVERLGRQRQLQLGQPAEQLAGAVQTQLHVKGAVQVRIVDKALPADRGARLLKVDPHDNVERVLIGVMQRFESGCVLFGGVHVVDGAGTTDHQQTMIATVDDVGDGVAGPLHECQRAIGDGQFLLELGRRDHHLFGLDMDVVQGISLHFLILSTVLSQGH